MWNQFCMYNSWFHAVTSQTNVTIIVYLQFPVSLWVYDYKLRHNKEQTA